MKKKKLLSALLMGVMSVSLLSGCGQASKESEADGGTGDFTISMLYCDAASRPYKADWKVFDIIKEHTGASFDIQCVPASDYNAKKNIVFASGNIPDIVSKYYATADDIASGLLLPISDYFDQMPNFQKYIEKNNLQGAVDNWRFSDGKVYTMPFKAHTSRLQERQWMVRKDIFEKNNIKIPTNLEELHDAAVKLKEIYPNSTPITNRYGAQNIMIPFASAFGTLAGNPIETAGGAYYNEEKKDWEFAPATEGWKKMLEYTKKLVEDGALDQEFATLDSTVYEQKAINGDAFIFYDWISAKARYEKPGKANDPDYNLQIIYPLKGENGNFATAPTPPFGMGAVLPASVAEKPYFKQLLKFLDWGFTDEAEQLLTFGIEGEDCEKVDGIYKYKESGVDYGATEGLGTNNLTLREHKDVLLQSLSPEEIKLFNKTVEDNCIKNSQPVPPLNEDQASELKIKIATLKDYISSMMLKFVFGKEPLSNYDNFVNECKAKGSDDIVKAFKEGQKEKEANIKK